jgi:hypothetical protein
MRAVKKSKAVRLGLLATAVGGVLSGCGGPAMEPEAPAVPPNTQVQQCVDAQGRVVPDEECDKQGLGAYAGSGHMGMTPFWIYHMGMPFRAGQVVPDAGLRTSPMSNVPTMRGSALHGGSGLGGKAGGVMRGGFGGSSSGHAIHS